MKKFLLLLLLLLPLAITSCGGDDKDEPESTANDPEGTIIANLMNDFYASGNGYWENGIEEMNGKGYCYLGLNPSNNLVAVSNNWYADPNIVSTGKVKGLSSITKIPETGWTQQTAAIPGYGYVYRIEPTAMGGTESYARIYVVDYIKNTAGGIIGVTIKYQQNWQP